MKAEILKLLRSADGFVSGQELCEHFGVSRTAVWKAIKQLEKEGYHVEAVPKKGYCLTESADLLNENELKSRIHNKWVANTLYYKNETTSTNLDAKRLAEEGALSGTLVVADKQTTGRGRRGRDWASPAGTAVYMTIMLKPELAPNEASMLTLVMALSVTKAIKEVTGLPARIKWPNDIVVNRKKVCGILTEMSAEMDFIHYVVIGVGINVNQKEFQTDIADTATSLFREHTGEMLVNRAQIIERTMHFFEADYDVFYQKRNLSLLEDAYNNLLVNKDTGVRVLDPKGEWEGIARGIDNMGNLIVETKEGTMIPVYAGEVSVRGFYGYV